MVHLVLSHDLLPLLEDLPLGPVLVLLHLGLLLQGPQLVLLLGPGQLEVEDFGFRGLFSDQDLTTFLLGLEEHIHELLEALDLRHDLLQLPQLSRDDLDFTEEVVLDFDLLVFLVYLLLLHLRNEELLLSHKLVLGVGSEAKFHLDQLPDLALVIDHLLRLLALDFCLPVFLLLLFDFMELTELGEHGLERVHIHQHDIGLLFYKLRDLREKLLAFLIRDLLDGEILLPRPLHIDQLLFLEHQSLPDVRLLLHLVLESLAFGPPALNIALGHIQNLLMEFLRQT